MTNITLLGRNGFIGSSIFNLLKNNLLIKAIDLPEFDLSSFDQNQFIDNYINKKSNNIIVNCIGIMGANHSKINPTQYLKTNGIHIQRLINIAQNYENIKIINLSSETIYGPQKNNFNPTENSKLMPSHVYSISKYIAEELLLLSDCNFLNLRIPIVIGKNPKEENPFTTFNNAYKSNTKATIFGDGTHYRKFITLRRLSFLIKKILRDEYWHEVGTYNLPGTKFIINQIFELYKKMSNKLDVNYLTDKTPYSLCSNHNKFELTFGADPIENFDSFFEELN
tara:strand:- start:2330 stop:3172 length:843 start_codon:yes stop_codon:yes gene_type:complete